MTIEKCDCGRPWCEYFDGSEGEYGTSYTREELENRLNEIVDAIVEDKKKVKEIKKILCTTASNQS